MPDDIMKTELLHRQIDPELTDGEVVSSENFRPLDKDEGCLSVDRDTLASPEQSYELFVGYGRRSCGVLSVAGSEVVDIELDSRPDPIVTGDEQNPAHAVIDFGEAGASQLRKKSRNLRNAAKERGWMYRPATADSD